MRALALSLVLATLSGCAGLLTGGPLIRNAGDPTGVIVVANESNETVTSVLVSHCSVSSYGLNRLPRGTEIGPGQAYEFTVSAGCWDVLAGNGGAEARQRMDVPAGSGVRYTVY
ncbi:MAG TPA: hypothetical protein VF576_11450 [Rubricoccaceae bacterium]